MNECVVEFAFEIRESFFDRGHRITVPKPESDTLRAARLDKHNLIVIYPRGEESTGRLGNSKAGWGPYYYIDIHGDLPNYLERYDQLIVELSIQGLSSQVTLTYASKRSYAGNAQGRTG